MSVPVMDDIALNQTYAHAVARMLVRPLIGTPIRPNHLTVLRMLVGAAACALLSLGSKPALLWSGLLWVLTCLLDRADGELARLGNMRSASGKVLDYYSDMILDAGWFLCAGIGLRHGALGDVAPALGVLTAVSLLVCSWSSEMFERLSAPGVRVWSGVKRFHPDDALFLLAPFTWLGWLIPILIAASACAPIIAIVILARYIVLKRQGRAARRREGSDE